MSDTPVPAATTSDRPTAPKRRVSAGYGAIGMAVVLAAVAVLFSWSERGHGVPAILAPLTVVLAVDTIILLVTIYPYVRLDPDRLAIVNTFLRYDIPYSGVVKATSTRYGVIITANGGKRIPVTSYAGSSGLARKANEAGAAALIGEIDVARERHPADAATRYTRTFEWRTAAAIVGTIVLAIVMVWASSATYH